MFKILVMGLPGSGKTTLAKRIASYNNCMHINADEARATLNSDLGFSLEDRIENARRLGCVADLINKNGMSVVVDFVCPTEETRAIFKPNFIIWMDTIEKGRFEDTNKLFVPPSKYNIRIENFDYKFLDVMNELCNKFYIKQPEV